MEGQGTTMQETGQAGHAAAEETKGAQAAEGGAAEKAGTLQKLISGLFGGGKEPGGEAGRADGQAAPAGSAEKSFTQAELDEAVEAARKQWADEAAEAERVKKLSPEERAAEEQKKKDARIADLEGQLLKKDLREAAVRALEKDGCPASLAEVLDYSSRERMEETLRNTLQVFKDSLAAAVQARLRGKTPEGLGGAASAENLLRDQIARNIRGL